MRIVMKFPVPKKNSRIATRSGRSFPSKRYSEWHKAVMANLPEQLGADMPKEPLAQVHSVEVHYIWPDRRRRDLTNFTESVMDVLVDAGILADDNWSVVPQLTMVSTGIVDKDGASVAVFINE